MKFQEQLVIWYRANARDLPWRRTKEPYRIWISEVMLQQTQVDTVISYYNRFMRVYPNVAQLAQAREDDVLKLWEGLGYYSRAKSLMACAKIIHTQYQDEFPRTYEALIKLPGIGPYTAGALMSIAFNLPQPAVDGNVMRVISRNYNLDADISDTKTRPVFENIVRSLMPEDRSGFTQGLMELGATVCTPKRVKCEVCPVAFCCEALSLGKVYERPIKTKKGTKINKHVAIAFVRCGDKILITKRPQGGLLGGLWGFPLIESLDEVTQTQLNWELINQWGQIPTFIQKGAKKKHVFTHLIWEMQVYEYSVPAPAEIDYPQIEWVSETNLTKYPFPTAFKKLNLIND